MTSRPSWKRIFLAEVAMCCLLTGGEAGAAVFSVNSTADQGDVDPGDGVCADATGKCTLRAAIQETNTTVEVDTVRLRAGLYRLTIGGVDRGAENGDLNIRHSLTILGAGANTTIVDGNGLDRVFNVYTEPNEQGKVSFSNLTIQNGSANVGGGLISGGATLSLKNCNILRNRATEEGGGMYLDSGDQVLVGCKVKNNIASGAGVVRGGGIRGSNLSSAVTLTRCEVSNNSAISTENSAEGGGLSFVSNTLLITGGRISDNVASGHGDGGWGGGIAARVDDTLTINGTTISGNLVACYTAGCESVGGGGTMHGPTISFKGTVSGNMAFGELSYCGGLSIYGSEPIQIQSSSIKNNVVVASDRGGAGGISTSGAVAQITSSTITGNSVSAPIAMAGGLFPSEATLTRVVVKDNSLRGSVSAWGGGIFSYGHLTLNATSVESNTAVSPAGLGGGVYSDGRVDPHDVDIMRASRIKFNFASSDGGGIFQNNDLVASTIGKSANSVVSGNLPNNSVPPLP